MTTPNFNLAPQGTAATDGFRSGIQLSSPYNVDPYSTYTGPGVDLEGLYAPQPLVPAAITVGNIAAAQIKLAAGYLTLTAGAGVTTNIINGVTFYNLGNPARVISVTGDANAAAFTATVYGLDCYGVQVGETIAYPGGATTINGKKTYKNIKAVYVSANTVGNVTVQTADIFGLNYYVSFFDYFAALYWNQALLVTAQFTPGVATPATATSGDVRGTIAVPNASDGTKRLFWHLNVPGLVKPQAAAVNASYIGVTQFYPAVF